MPGYGYSLAGKLGGALYRLAPRAFYSTKRLRIDSQTRREFRRRDPGDSGRIREIDLELTIVCNLRCSFCWWWGDNGTAFDLAKNKAPVVAEQLTTEQVMSLVDDAQQAGVEAFYLSGGEPFIRRDAIDIVEYIAARGMRVTLTTNGTLLSDEIIGRLAKVGELVIVFSVDGPREVHDNIRGRGMFDQVVFAIRKLHAARGGNDRPYVATNTTFTPELLGRTVDLVHELQDVGVNSVGFQHLWFTDEHTAHAHTAFLQQTFGVRDTGVSGHQVASLPDSAYAARLAREIEMLQGTRFERPIHVKPQLTSSEILQYYANLGWARIKRCTIAWNSIKVKADGQAMFCPDDWVSKVSLGNVKDMTLAELWNSQNAKKFRRALAEHKLFPACSRCCYINP